MSIYITLTISVLLNGLLFWYVARLLKKFLFISENLSDLYLTTKAFAVFIESLFAMDSYHGEPMIQELMHRVQEVSKEMEKFRDTFEYTLDAQLEEELNGTNEEKEA